MDKKYAHAYMTGLSKTADLSSFVSSAGNFASKVPGFVYHAVADPAVGMVRDTGRTWSKLIPAYGKFFRGDFQGARAAVPGVFNSAGSAIGNGALTGINLLGAIASIPGGGAPEAGLLAAETAVRTGGLSALKGILGRSISAIKQPISNAVSSATSGAARAIGPAATNAASGVNQAFWPWFSQGFNGISSGGISHLGQITQGLTRATQPVANLIERMGIEGASSAYSNAGTSLANKLTLKLPQSYSGLPWYKGGPASIPLLQMGGGITSALKQSIPAINSVKPPVQSGFMNNIRKSIHPSDVMRGVIPLALAGGAGIGLYNLTKPPKKKNTSPEVIN